MVRTIEDQFTEAMFEIYRRAKAEARYTASIFYKMVCDNGGRATAKTLINAPEQSAGYTALMLKRRLDLTVEAMVVENRKWHELFEKEELERARVRLKQNHYVPKEPA